MILIKIRIFLFRVIRKFVPIIWRFKSTNNESILLQYLEEEISLLKTGTSWDNFQFKIYSEIKRLGFSRFRLSPTIISTMDPPMPFLIGSVMALNINDRIYLKKLAKKYNKIGGGMRGTIYFSAPDSRIQKILTLIELKSELDKFYTSNFEKNSHQSFEFVEFGGGIGQFAELVIRELSPNSYTIIDLPLVSALARYYLNYQKLNINPNFISSEKELLFSKKSIKVFISSWAISELKLSRRKQIEEYMAKMDYLFIEMQESFDNVDNYEWISEFLSRNPQYRFTWSKSNRAMRSRVYRIYRIPEESTNNFL
jgi:hypothetical protein